MTSSTARLAKVGLALGLGAVVLAGAPTPTYAGDAGAIAAGVIGGAALGALAGSAAAGAYGPGPGYYYAPPPPPPAYVEPAPVYAAPPPAYGAPPPSYVEPVDAPPPPRCHRVYVRTWDPYAGTYVDRPSRVCDAY